MPASHRAMAAASQRLHGRGIRACTEGRGGGRCRACQGQQQGAAAWRAARPQGHVLRRRPRLHLRLADPARLRGLDHLDRAAAPERCRRDPARHPADGGVRLWADRPQRALWPRAQSVETRSRHRRLVVRLRLRRGGAIDLCRARLRHRRLDPHARAFLRRHRLESDVGPGQPRRRDAAVAVARHRRSAGADGGGLRTAARPDGRPRSGGSDRKRGAGSGLRGGNHRLDQGPQNRRAQGVLCR